MFPKGGMGKLMKQAQEMQAKMAKAQDELASIEVEGQSGGGMIIASVNGKKELLSLKIQDEVLEEDKEMIEDLVVAAVNQALQNASKAADEKMSSATGGMMGNMKIPGM
jgi:DNA-binding YbaB/EbfC family protein|tara:strand:+ start:1338 stop:1664 length:327 start_codon:yes stop_codon:yes gene_type:complete